MLKLLKFCYLILLVIVFSGCKPSHHEIFIYYPGDSIHENILYDSMEYNELEKTISFIVIIDDNGETYVNDFTRVNNLEIIFDSVSYLFGNSYDDKLDRGIEYDIILNSTIVGNGDNIKLENSNENELIYIFHINKLGILEDIDSSSVIELYINIDEEELALSILFD